MDTITKTVIVTGGVGFIGRNIAKKFKEENYYVIGVGHGKHEKEFYDSFGIDMWYEADISIELLNKISAKPDYIIHCAGGSTVGISISNPYLDYHKTVNSTLELLEYIRVYCPEAKLVYLSSAAVYGQKDDSPINESDTTNPVSPYGFHKLASEDICKSYSHCFGVKVAIIRLFSIYGNGLQKQLLWDACNKIISAKESVSFFGTGEETRDWVHVNDVTKLVYQLTKTNFAFEVYNGASGKRTTVSEIIYMLKSGLGKFDMEIIFNQHQKSGDPLYYWGAMKKVVDTGWKPEEDLNIGIGKYINWFKAII